MVTVAQEGYRHGIIWRTLHSLFLLLTEKFISDMSHMLSSVSEDSPLGVILFVLNGVAAETWADIVKKKKVSRAAMIFCACSALSMPNFFCKGQKGRNGSHHSAFNTSASKNKENNLSEVMYLWYSCSDVPTLLFNLKTLSLYS